MHQLADQVWHIPLMARDGVNAYLLGDVLVDAGYKGGQGRKAIAAVRDHGITAHALTHAHVDHAGGSAQVCAELGVDGVAVGAADAADARSGRPEPPAHTPASAVGRRLGAFPPAPVARELREGDAIGPGFTVLEAPGHSRGHVAFWRESDGVLICGDVFFNMSILTTAPGLREPPRLFTVDPAQNRRSARRLAALRPRIAGFGHGPVLRDPGRLEAFAAELPED